MNRAGALGVVLWQLVAAAPASAAAQAFPVPGKSYALSIDLSGCTTDEDRAERSGAGRYVRAHCANGLNVSFWILPAEKPGDSKVCRDTWWKKEGIAQASMRELGDLAIVDYVIGDDVKQRNVRAYLAHRDTWIDVHLSKVELGGGRGGGGDFDRLLRSVAIVTPIKDPDLRIASQYFLKRDYRNAAIHYQKVIDREKQSRTLGETEWRVAVDNLAMAYGISGDFARAEAVLKYGISEDPEYPMFYYNLACTHAEKNDLPNAIAMLKKAFALKENMIEGEQIPDPRTDSSFEKYLANESFQKALREIGV